ncbi:hypothetical protein BVG79_01970 [Ketogulonicigenium robustum]|uniref:DUF707 domain-containing protein n=1 Tax=Ketogulonicigenium robustum TaxID=92947 RepID=A0A1W6P1C4_9RHOB|nr:DUF707 domain-containing protein [Ketogulonicigenium robustum]ARO15312.1 hypothetical protein BVG79_01970 [Ketogulonicigenium robustum]
MTRKNLVVVRAGSNSLHHRWLDIPDDARSYDVVVSFFDTAAFAAFQPRDGVRAVLIKGGKWDGLFKTFADIDIDAYDYFWLPDDDIDASATTVNEIFRLCRQSGLAVAQPALTHDSYFSHFIFMQCPGFRLRYTNYVEIMVPCLNRNILRQALPLFEGTMSGFGLDYTWCRWADSGPFNVAILDTVAVHHTRPVGKVLQSAMTDAGKPTSEEEEEILKARYDLVERTVPLAFAGVRTDGGPVIGRVAVGWRMVRGWWPIRHTFHERRKAFWAIIKIARRQLTKRLDMRTL